MTDNLTEIVGSITALAKQRDEAQAKHDELQKAALDLLDVVERESIVCTRCSRPALAVDSVDAYCDEHMPANKSDLKEMDYAPALRRMRALAGVRCGITCAADTKREAPCVLPEGHQESHRDSNGWTWRNMRRE